MYNNEYITLNVFVFRICEVPDQVMSTSSTRTNDFLKRIFFLSFIYAAKKYLHM